MKGQATLEFIILLVFSTMIFLSLFIVLGQRMVDLNEDKEERTIRQLMDVIVDEVSVAQTVEDGYKRKFLVPKQIYGDPYEINVTNHFELTVKFNNKEYVEFLPAYVMGGFCFDPADTSNFYELSVSKSLGIVSLSSCFDCGWSYAVCANAEKDGLCKFQDDLWGGGFNETCCTGHCKCCPY